MDQLRQMLEGKMARNAFAVSSGMELEAVEPDHAVIRMEVRPESCNPMGTVHGGAMFTMADSAAGLAIFTDGRIYVTQTGSLSYLRNVSGGVIRASGTVRHRGYATACAQVDITAEDGALLATGEFSFFCLDATARHGQGT